MCSPYNPICDLTTVLGKVGGSVAGSVFNEVAKAFASAAKQVTDWMWTVIARTTTVDLSGGWFTSTLGITVSLAGLVIAALFALELVKAVLRREPGALGRAAVGVGAGILGAAASIGVVTALLKATDALSDGVVKTAGLDSIDKLGGEIAPTAALNSIGSPALMLILAIGYLLASFFVWAMFIFRKAMLIVAAVFAPIAFAGAPMRATSAWVRRWVEFTLTMIFSKLVVVVLFTLAVSLVGSPGAGFAAVGNLFSGLAMLVIACFAPWLLFRLVHFVGGDIMTAHHQAMTQSTLQAGATPLSMARGGAMKVASLVGDGPAGASGAGLAVGAAGASTAANQVPSTPGGSSEHRSNPHPANNRHGVEDASSTQGGSPLSSRRELHADALGMDGPPASPPPDPTRQPHRRPTEPPPAPGRNGNWDDLDQ